MRTEIRFAIGRTTSTECPSRALVDAARAGQALLRGQGRKVLLREAEDGHRARLVGLGGIGEGRFEFADEITAGVRGDEAVVGTVHLLAFFEVGEALFERVAEIGAFVEGVDRLNGAEHTVINDRIEAASFAAAAIITGGDVLVEGAEQAHMLTFLNKLRQVGAGLMLYAQNNRGVFPYCTSFARVPSRLNGGAHSRFRRSHGRVDRRRGRQQRRALRSVLLPRAMDLRSGGLSLG